MNPAEDYWAFEVARRHFSMAKVDLVDMVHMVDMVDNIDIMNTQNSFGNL
jgi:hypothetical protein